MRKDWMQAMGVSFKRRILKAFPQTVSKLGTSNIFQQEGNSERICWVCLKQKIEPVAVKFKHSGYTFEKIHNVESKSMRLLGFCLSNHSNKERTASFLKCHKVEGQETVSPWSQQTLARESQHPFPIPKSAFWSVQGSNQRQWNLRVLLPRGHQEHTPHTAQETSVSPFSCLWCGPK